MIKVGDILFVPKDVEDPDYEFGTARFLSGIYLIHSSAGKTRVFLELNEICWSTSDSSMVDRNWIDELIEDGKVFLI